jgi:hypothetical protein
MNQDIIEHRDQLHILRYKNAVNVGLIQKKIFITISYLFHLILFHLSNLPVKYNTLSYEILNSWIYSESESLTQRIKINSSDKNDVYESTDEICNFAEPSEVPSDGHGEILPNPTQVSFQDLPQENLQFTGL